MFKFSGQRPTNLGVSDGKLASCPVTPNCVCSYDTDAQHAIAPIAYTTSQPEAMTILKQVISALERTEIVTETNDYLYVEFSTQLMGFVDDVEFYFVPTEKLIQVRSASRLGKSDLGTNRKRIEQLRENLKAAGI